MRIFLLIAISSIVALLIDWYIYRRVISRHNFGKVWKIGYLVYAFVVDTMVVSALLTYRSATDADDGTMLRGIMWVVAFFFLNAVPKSVYTLISLGDYPVQRRRKKVSHIFGYTGTALAAVVACAILYSMTYGRSIIRVERVEIRSEKLPESFDGFRVAAFSDPHIGTLVNRYRFMARLADTINSLEPDMVVQAGDLVNIHVRELDPLMIKALSSIRSRYGVYSVMGNHDLGIYIRDTLKHSPEQHLRELTAMQEHELGWHLLRNRTVFVSNGRDSITVTGIDYPYDPTLNSHSQQLSGSDIPVAYAGIPDSLFNVALSHAPQLWDELLADGHADLTIAGHVHSMQIKFSVGKWSWSPAALFYHRWSGLYEQKGKYLYINDGAGNVMFPARVGTKPEVTLFILRSTRKP